MMMIVFKISKFKKLVLESLKQARYNSKVMNRFELIMDYKVITKFLIFVLKTLLNFFVTA